MRRTTINSTPKTQYMSKLLITGGTGLIGSELCKILVENKVEVVILTTQRKVSAKNPKVQYVYWNPRERFIDLDFTIKGVSILNLAGAGVAERRWTPIRKQEIIDSRIQSLQTLYRAIASGQIQATNLLSASAIGFYAKKDQPLNEEDPPDNSFLSTTCTLWEKEAARFRTMGIPTAIARVGIVLSKEGGALKEFLKPLQFGIAGIPGNGKQIMSWIHIEDICRMLLHILQTHSNETFNAVADIPASTNELFDAILQTKKGMKIHIPKVALELALGEMSIEILKSAWVSNQKIRQDGFQCQYPTIELAIQNLLQ